MGAGVFIEGLRWAGAALLAIGALWVISMNTWGAILWYTKRVRSSSVSFVGGLLGAGAVLLVPIGDWQTRARWCWLPAVLDWTVIAHGPWLLFVVARYGWTRARRR